ncbi:hypothetical protein SDJN03_07163, partial [Cucurbita argyrosperma subsp. sororia]
MDSATQQETSLDMSSLTWGWGLSTPLEFQSINIKMHSPRPQPANSPRNLGKTILNLTFQAILALSISAPTPSSSPLPTVLFRAAMFISFQVSFAGVFLKNVFPRIALLLEKLGALFLAIGVCISGAGPKPGTKEEGGVIRPLELQRVLNCSCQYFHFSSSNKDGSVAIDGSNHILLKLSHHLSVKPEKIIPKTTAPQVHLSLDFPCNQTGISKGLFGGCIKSCTKTKAEKRNQSVAYQMIDLQSTTIERGPRTKLQPRLGLF